MIKTLITDISKIINKIANYYGDSDYYFEVSRGRSDIDGEMLIYHLQNLSAFYKKYGNEIE